MIYKSYLLEQNIELIKNNIFLFYGENDGLKNEFKKKIRLKKTKKEILVLNQDEILKNQNSFINEISNQSLFGEQRIFFINQVNDKFYDILEETVDLVKKDQIFLFAENLDKKSKLRNFIEKSNTLGLSPCYNDNEITIKRIISERLKSYKGMSTHLIDLIIENTGLDRNKINNEIEKIESCFENKIIEPEKVILLLNLRSNEDFSQLKDAAFSGKRERTNKLLANTNFDYENNVYYLNILNQRLNRLSEINNLKKTNNKIETIIAMIKPPIFWKDKPVIEEQSKKWSGEKLNKVLQKFYNAEISIKSNTIVKKDLILKDLIIFICVTANAA